MDKIPQYKREVVKLQTFISTKPNLNKDQEENE